MYYNGQNNLIKLTVLEPIWKNRRKHSQSANRASSGASQVRLHICRVTLEPSPQTLCLLTVWFLYKLAFNLLLMTQCAQTVSNIAVYGSAMQLAFNSWLIDTSDTVEEFDSDRCFFYCDCLTSGKFCMSKHSCSYFIIVPWNNIQNDYYSLFFYGESVHLHRLIWVFVLVLKYHALAQITIYVPFIRTVNAVVRLHQQPWHI